MSDLLLIVLENIVCLFKCFFRATHTEVKCSENLI